MGHLEVLLHGRILWFRWSLEKGSWSRWKVWATFVMKFDFVGGVQLCLLPGYEASFIADAKFEIGGILYRAYWEIYNTCSRTRRELKSYAAFYEFCDGGLKAAWPTHSDTFNMLLSITRTVSVRVDIADRYASYGCEKSGGVTFLVSWLVRDYNSWISNESASWTVPVTSSWSHWAMSGF